MAKVANQHNNKTQRTILNNPNINVFSQHYLNALAHLSNTSSELADRALKIAESEQAKREQTTDKILEMEEKEQNMRAKELTFQNLWYGLGMFSFIVMFLLALSAGVYLSYRC